MGFTGFGVEAYPVTAQTRLLRPRLERPICALTRSLPTKTTPPPPVRLSFFTEIDTFSPGSPSADPLLSYYPLNYSQSLPPTAPPRRPSPGSAPIDIGDVGAHAP